MKEIIILMFALLSCKCNSEMPADETTPYRMGFIIDASGVKDPEVKYIKVAIKSIDKILPKYKVRSAFHSAYVHYDMATGAYVITQQREARTGDGNKTYYFVDIYVLLNYYGPGAVPYTAGKDRIFELKIYKNDDLFLTKKITLRSNRSPHLKRYWSGDPNNLFAGYTDKVEVDNMDYVKEINVGDRQGRALIIEIPDKPIKK